MFNLDLAKELEATTSSSAETPAGETSSSASSKARATGAARGGSHDTAGARGHTVEITGEHHRVEIWAVGAAVPIGRLRHDALKGLAPVLFHAECHGEGQKFLEHLWRFDSAIEAVGFDVIQEIFEAKNAFHGAGALLGVRGHKPAEATDHQAR
jgi:hypothetical protein